MHWKSLKSPRAKRFARVVRSPRSRWLFPSISRT